VKRYLTAAACLLTLAACSTTAEPGTAAPAPAQIPTATPKSAKATGFNDTDVMFLQMMIPHHEQGMEMVRLAEQKATRPEVKDLVAAIGLTQADEVKNMSGWLTSWGRPTTPDSDPGAHVQHGGLPATNPEVIAELSKSAGPDFETKFLNLFTGHQGAAVEMAQLEVGQGTNQEVKDLADRVVKSRTGQIQQMLSLLGQQ
jgi:uncharacterized protein (DUF305 family)